MTQETRGAGRGLLLVIAVALLAVLGVVLALKLGGGRRVRTEELNGAAELLRQMEAGDPDQVVQVIRRQQKARMAAQRDELEEKLLSGEIDVYSLFQDFAMFGDSRACVFYWFYLLPNERILANPSNTIRTMEERIPDLVDLHPARVYIAYGVNDINIGFWANKEEYTAELEKILGEIEEAVPGIEIYVNSILEVQDWALSKGAMWKYIPEYNEAIRVMCEAHGYTFIDNHPLTEAHQDLYDVDGIHFKEEFTKYWAINMILATYFRGGEEDAA